MKWKKFLGVVACAVLVASFGLVVTACGKKEATLPEIDEAQQSISMEVSATSDKMLIDITSNEEDVGNAETQVVALPAYEYLVGDQYSGLSEDIIDIADATVVGEYTLGTNATVEFDRVDVSGYDAIYNKYYIVAQDKILKGPIYTTDIEAEVSAEPTFSALSKKGLLGESVEAYDDLGCSYVTLNFEINRFVYPNEIFEDGQAVALSHPDTAIEFVSNGKTFYFNHEMVDYFDRLVSSYYNLGANITAIIYAPNNVGNWETFPEKLTYAPWSAQGTTLMALNTSNSYGFEYYIAIIEFLADRYTQNNLENGFISNFVIGNEIDYAKDFNRISEKQVSLDTYMEEYSRLLRLANLAGKKYHEDITVSIPLTQAWAEKGYDNTDEIQPYAPKDMIEWLNAKTKQEGDYDWGLAPHSYTYGLASSEVLLMDTLVGKTVGMTGDFNTSSKITFSNIEILDEYLNQDYMKFDGQVRSVYLTESGVSSNTADDATTRGQQAGSIAAVWYKISQIDSIKAWFYYRVQDAEGEAAASARLGLIDLEGNRKPAYDVYKYIDTQYSRRFADQYIGYISYVAPDGTNKTYGNGISSYADCLDVFGTGYDFSHMDMTTPVTIDPVYEWEDVIDLGDVAFESNNFLYDGTEKSIAVTGLPEGVDVAYDVEPTQTEVGSKTILATFTQDGEVVGHREATITVSKLATNKTVYEYGENVYVTTTREGEELTSDAWIGIYHKNAGVGNVDGGEVSVYYYYFNNNSDDFIRTVCIQDQIDNQIGGLTPGEYVIYYFVTGEYEYKYSIEIEVLPAGEDNGSANLSNITFSDKTVEGDGSEQSLVISGELPEGVSVSYENNTATATGTYQAVAIFSQNGVEIERRYAVLTVVDSLLMLEKTTFYVGETINVTASAPESSANEQWWVGLYLSTDSVEEDTSIYWFYVKDDNHVSGGTYNIKEQSHNADRGDYADLPAGEYKMVLFNTSGYSIQQVIDFEIVEAPTEI